MSFARDRLVEAFSWSVGITLEPQYIYIYIYFKFKILLLVINFQSGYSGNEKSPRLLEIVFSCALQLR